LKDFYLDKLKFEQADVYVNPQMSKEERQNSILLYQKSKLRIDSLFGSTEAKPVILVGNTDEIMQLFGQANAQGQQVQTGMTHLTPFGAYIILSPDGTNIDVLSHELCHAELMERLGWKIRRQKIPIWFDEGLAMLVDKRFEYWMTLQEDWRDLVDSEKKDSSFDNSDFYPSTNSDSLAFASFSLQNLQTTEQFFTENAQMHYFLAQEEVSRWYNKKGQKGLLELIDKLKENSFEENYETIKNQ
jgi:hypothetical protein